MESKPVKILAIDDNPDNLTTIKALVREAFPSAQIFTATNGEKGVALARAEDPDVVLLDILMPGMDGFAVCRTLKSEEALRDIPVVFVTALKAYSDCRIRALEVGAEGFLNKPIDESELTAQIQAMVKIKAAHVKGQGEKMLLETMVAERTEKLEKELVERIITETALLMSEERYRRILEGITDYVYSVSVENGRAVQTIHGAACEKVTGYSARDFAADPNLWITMVPEEDRQGVIARVGEILAGKQIPAAEHRIRRKDGEIRWVRDATVLHTDAHGRLLSYDGVVKDITEIREIEARLRQSEKMEAIGTLAGGIAHDFNNVLGGIIGYSEMSLDLAEKGSILERNLLQVLKASDRARNLVRQILTFSRKGKQEKTVIEIQPIVKEVLDLLQASIPSSVIIESDLRKNTKPVFADATKIHEIILNLVTNAVYAMKRKGTLTVRLYAESLKLETSCILGKIAPGEYTVIEIADTGCGMDISTLSKAFDPFFTTKPVGEGTGMGLSVVMGVLQSHGGDLQVTSEPGKGATFRVFLPVTAEAVAENAKTETSDCQGGAEKILFVDDETVLGDVAFNQLTTLGYAVTCMTDSIKALQFIKENRAGIDLLVTDLTMPGMTGVELAKAALQINNSLPIILCTGFNNEIKLEQASAAGISRLARKPIHIRDFAKIVREVLDNCKKERYHVQDTRD